MIRFVCITAAACCFQCADTIMFKYTESYMPANSTFWCPVYFKFACIFSNLTFVKYTKLKRFLSVKIWSVGVTRLSCWTRIQALYIAVVVYLWLNLGHLWACMSILLYATRVYLLYYLFYSSKWWLEFLSCYDICVNVTVNVNDCGYDVSVKFISYYIYYSCWHECLT